MNLHVPHLMVGTDIQIERHFLRLRARGDVSAEEEQAIRSAIGEIREYPAQHVVIPAYVEQGYSTLLLEGIMCRYKDLRDGQRQVTELHVSGDFVDLHSFTLKYLDHDVMTLSPCRVARVPHENLRRITEQLPNLTRLYWFSTNLDAAIHREWEVSLGRRTGRARVAMLLCELQARLKIVGLADDTGYELSLTQTEISECVGLTNVHVNRVLRELRQSGIVDLRGGRVAITNLAALRDAAEFDPRYLYLDHRHDQ
ncbi:Crp/Fnr family transcriptional regulator [Novosphingobium sp. Leaf2]|uniref:Crp/Fnr family transcriptional regulator n=1 Tax=Novosphingobium sp. Leaf2 TaxID=1735670 RepID=UPI0006F3C2F5|nr:Crp/Fnr family transcriptional regulator [Novosphingobium sp. Leaf2]KQM21084.1 Crp/Fnr family transcriptional regulator [Novosphingobium sp. Leaf2]